MVSFKEYLETCRFSDSPEADFVADAEADGNLHAVGSWSELHEYLSSRPHISPQYIEAARVVWEAYESSQP
jgi:hypothetical protein